MNKETLFLTEGDKKSSLNTWKTQLITELENNNISVGQLNVCSPYSLLKILEVIRYRNIHSYHISGFSVLFLVVSRMLGRKIIFTLHGDYIKEKKDKNGLKKIFWTPFFDFSIFLADKVTVASEYLKNQIIKSRNIDHKKFIVIPNGITAESKERFKKNSSFSKVRKLLSVTSFKYKEKAEGVRLLIEAFHILQIKFEGLTLLVLGDGRYLKNYIDEFRDYNIGFLGHKKNPEKYFLNADLFVHSTYLDNFPLVVLEAMKYRLPVISVKVGGIPEMLPLEALSELDAILLAKKIEKAIINTEYRKKLVTNNIYKLQMFYWGNVVHHFINLYEN